ncbi:hypothetical protein [Longirhabdus pacifica]|uniref:hypothetical protein n=1 Tax=Longirhabdus pacifica TaxID=2305227 RepID=UPI001008B1AD|nr:hypothetical protein [Longirhabdus pacifica]
MPNETPKLGIKKPLINEYVELESFNYNWDAIDENAASVDELLQQKQLLQEQIDGINEVLGEAYETTSSLETGLNVITTDKATPLYPNIKGRTLLNVLGDKGGIVTGTFNNNYSSISYDTTEFIVGNQSLKITISSDKGFGTGYYSGLKLEHTKHYILMADVKNGNAQSIKLYIDTKLNDEYSHMVGNEITQQQFQPSYIKLDAASFQNDNGINIHGYVRGDDGQYGYMDALRVYEITKEQYDLIDVHPEWTGNKLAEKFPYVNGIQHTTPIIRKRGKNIIPTNGFYNMTDEVIEKEYIVTPFVTNINKPSVTEKKIAYTYDFDHDANISHYTISADIEVTNVGGNNGFFVEFAEIDNEGITVYKGSIYNMGYLKESGHCSFTLTPQPDTVKILANWVVDKEATGTWIITNPMVSVGKQDLPFESPNHDRLQINTPLGSGLDGSSPDELYFKEGTAYISRHWEKDIPLYGSLDWYFTSQQEGYKEYAINNIVKDDSGSKDGEYVYGGSGDRKFYPYYADFREPDTVNIASSVSDGHLYIRIRDEVTGFTNEYTPKAKEIKAFFNGWKVKTHVDGVPTSWVSVVDDSEAPTQSLDFVASNHARYYEPYLLCYRRSQPIEEQAYVEGALSLHAGDNLIRLYDDETALTPLNVAIKYNTSIASVQEALVAEVNDVKSTAISKSGDIITGDFIHDCKTQQHAFYFSRQGRKDKEFLSVNVGDITALLHYKNDEAASRIKFSIENTDTETTDGVNANATEFVLTSDKNGGRMEMIRDGSSYEYLHTGQLRIEDGKLQFYDGTDWKTVSID